VGFGDLFKARTCSESAERLGSHGSHVPKHAYAEPPNSRSFVCNGGWKILTAIIPAMPQSASVKTMPNCCSAALMNGGRESARWRLDSRRLPDPRAIRPRPRRRFRLCRGVCELHTLARGTIPKEYADGYFLRKSMMKWYWDAYLPDPARRREVYASPLQAAPKHLVGLPPALHQAAEELKKHL
jgi:hypothetical protein